MIQPVNSLNLKYKHQFCAGQSPRIAQFTYGNDTVKPSKQKKNPPTYQQILMGICGTALISCLAWKLFAKRAASIKELKQLKTEMNHFPKDIEYRKTILKNLNLPESDYPKLRSIIGIDEFDAAIKSLSKNKENFLPGTKSYRIDNEAIFPLRENVQTGKFAANLHTHTIYSDGKLTIPELLEQATKYADRRVEKLGKEHPFYIAITDHDTVHGCKEAVDIIMKNPEKYKNLRLILGIEHTTITDYPNVLNGAVHTHMITYGINPYNKSLNDFLNSGVNKNKENIKKVLTHANDTFSTTLKRFGVSYNYDELTQLAPCIKYELKPADYYTKDYMQFKLIYSALVEKNEKLNELLKSHKIDINFTTPVSKIAPNPDYSNGQKYYEYYFKAIKDELNSLSNAEISTIVENQLKTIPKELLPILNEIEASIYHPYSKLKVPVIDFPQFRDVVEFMSSQENIKMGIAHPGVVFPFSNLKSEEDTIRFYELLYRDFKTLGGNKAAYTEDNYAAYFKKNEPTAEKLSQLSSSLGFEKTGGLDTHISDIFCSK